MGSKESHHTVKSSFSSIADRLIPHVPPDSPPVHHVRVLPQHTVRPKAHDPVEDSEGLISFDQLLVLPPHFGSQSSRFLITVIIPSCQNQLWTTNLIQNLKTAIWDKTTQLVTLARMCGQNIANVTE